MGHQDYDSPVLICGIIIRNGHMEAVSRIAPHAMDGLLSQQRLDSRDCVGDRHHQRHGFTAVTLVPVEIRA